MLLLLLPTYLIVNQGSERDRSQAILEVKQELNLLSHLVTNLLQSGDYEAVQSMIDQWSVNNPTIQQITLITQNGFRIAEMGTPHKTEYQHTESSLLKYGYRGKATLQLTKDIGWVHEHFIQILVYTLLAWLSVGLFGFYLIRYLLIREYENSRLQQLSNELSSTNRRLDREQMLLRSLIDSIPDLIFFKDKDSVYLGCNKAFERFSGLPEAAQVGKTDYDLFDADSASLFQARDKAMMQTGNPRRYEEWVTYPDGRKVLLDTLKTPYFDNHDNLLGLIGISRDITELKEVQNQLEEMAYHDALTHLPNRRHLVERLGQAIAQADRNNTKLAICTIDLDGFKPIKVLIEFASRLQASLRAEDTVARWGGDEFTLLFTNLRNFKECIELVERLQQLFTLQVEVEDYQFTLSASVGITIYPDDKNNADTLMRHADQAMYEAKLAGKNQYHVFDPEQDKALHSHHENRGRFEQAINRNELTLFYQPQVHLRQGAPYGVEALVRWNHPEQGLLAPAMFLPYIEGHNLSIKLDWWVLETAFAQVSEWISGGNFFHMSINISALSFKQVDFVSRLEDLLEKYPRVLPEIVSLELLETAALGNLELIADKMRECQKLGFQFCLDDFGTGYSSLTHLGRLPANVLKIDQSFVRDMLIDERDANIVEGIIRLSAAFKRMVIAEGVEEILHGVKLIEMGCNYAQGYAIAKPMPAENLDEWLSKFQAPEEWLKSNRPKLSLLNGKNDPVP